MKNCKQRLIVTVTIVFSFYVSTYSLKPQMEAWKRAAKDGHEIGNHSLRLSIYQRVEDLLSLMTLEEKLGQLNMPYPGEMAKDLPGQIDACRKFA